jgi:hypothetical protein
MVSVNQYSRDSQCREVASKLTLSKAGTSHSQDQSQDQD